MNAPRGLPPGFSRTALRRDHLLITPADHVRAPLPGWTNTAGIILISPRLGAAFSQYIAEMDEGGESGPPLPGVERFLYVVRGEIELRRNGTPNACGCESASLSKTASGGAAFLGEGGYAYLPPGTVHTARALTKAQVIAFEKRYQRLDKTPTPGIAAGNERDVKGTPFLGDPDAVLQTLLPDHPAFDMAVNIFTFQPGASLPRPEIHVMEHGLVFLAGGGIYRLGDNWYPVQEGDVIWMAPFCPQWFAAVGKMPARYLYYKDVNRDPLAALAEYPAAALQANPTAAHWANPAPIPAPIPASNPFPNPSANDVTARPASEGDVG